MLKITALEVISILVRSRNRGTITLEQYRQASVNFRAEIVNSRMVTRVSVTDKRIAAAAKLIPKHSINATDALVLTSSLELRGQLQAAGDSLVLVAADQRLTKAAAVEGLVTFDPERQAQAELDVLLKS
jgi:predicted nucleic acid-binding protein